MSQFKIKLRDKLLNYFNKVLKDSLGYKEVFSAKMADTDRVILFESISDSGLIQMLNNNEMSNKIEKSIQDGIKEEGINIKIFIISDNEFVLQY